MQLKPVTFAVAMAFSLAGCTSLAPEYEKPDVALSNEWTSDAWINESLKESAHVTPSQLGWREFFIDPYLQALIESAIENNSDLRKAALNVQLAEQQHRISEAGKLPSVGLSASSKRQRGFGGALSENYQVGLGLSNYELDFFGRVKNKNEAALNQYLQTREARDVAQLSIINAVAKLYYQQRIGEKMRELAEKTLASRQQSYKLIQLRFQEGLATGTDLTTAQTLIANAQSSYEKQDRSVKQTQNALVTLVGKPLEQLVLPPSNGLDRQFPNKAIFADLPSEVLSHRPDIRQAEYGLKAANANIGVAKAALYPSISLTGNLGYVSPQFNMLFEDSTRIWSIGPSLSLPIFNGGQLKSNVKISELQQKMAVETYQQTVRKAFQEVADALVARETLLKQYQAEQNGLMATAKTLALVKVQLEEGLVNGLQVLDVERSDYNARLGLLATQLSILANQVDLYTTMGGGLQSSTRGLADTAPFPTL